MSASEELDKEEFSFIIEKENHKKRLDKVLADLCGDLSRSRLQSLIQEGAVFINGLAVTQASHKVELQDCVYFQMPALEEALPEPQNIPLNIVFEDEDLLVINKPAGLVVHPGAGNSDGTLVNALLHHCKDQLSGIGGVKRPGIVHRIDKETSGLLVVAKNDSAHQGLSEQLADRSLGRVYTALCWGVPLPALGKVDRPIARDPKDRLKMCVRARDGRDAVTHYKTVQAFGKADAKHKANGLSLIECKLETGRTHQIRVHMQYIGHSLIGDPNYAAQPSFQKACLKNIGMDDEGQRNVFLDFPRQALHARKLHFIHPRTQEHMAFEAPLADDLQTLIEALSTYS